MELTMRSLFGVMRLLARILRRAYPVRGPSKSDC
jgi:hypothetical protein